MIFRLFFTIYFHMQHLENQTLFIIVPKAVYILWLHAKLKNFNLLHFRNWIWYLLTWLLNSHNLRRFNWKMIESNNTTIALNLFYFQLRLSNDFHVVLVRRSEQTSLRLLNTVHTYIRLVPVYELIRWRLRPLVKILRKYTYTHTVQTVRISCTANKCQRIISPNRALQTVHKSIIWFQYLSFSLQIWIFTKYFINRT